MLKGTGIPLGIDEDEVWRSEQLSLSQGDLLVMYTVIATDAQNGQGELFESERLFKAVQVLYSLPAAAILKNDISEIQAFAGDDITLLVAAHAA